MTEDELMRALRSVGMAAFVRHMTLWENRQDSAGAAETLHLRTGWRPTACRTRVTYARAILNAGLRQTALERVIAAVRVDAATRDQARRLLRG